MVSVTHPLNVEGPFYINNNCQRCTWCQVMAPEFFEVNKEGSFVKKQPHAQSEVEVCDKILAGCPAKAIKKKSA